MKALLGVVGICGIGISVCGAMMLENISQLGVPVFGPLEKNSFNAVFADLRIFAYAAIAFGILLAIGCCVAWWRRKS